MMGFLPLGKDFRRGWGWDDQILKLVHHRRGNNLCTGPADHRYFHPAFRRLGDVIIEAVQQARQHDPH